jgi:GxxExxY protein
MNENEIAQQIVDAALRVHMALGPGLLESVYQATLEYELKERRLRVSPQLSIPVAYKSVRIQTGFHADLLVENKVNV